MATSSLARLEFVLNSGEASNQQTANGSNHSSSVGASSLLPSWLGGGTSSSTGKSLPQPAGSSPSSSSTASSAAAAAAASATAVASKAAAQTTQWFHAISAKVQGKEPPPLSNAPAVDLESGAGGGEAGSRGLLSSDPGGAASGLAAQFTNEMNALTTLSWKQRLIAFMMSLTVGLVMMFMAFSFLPMVFIGAPAKFAISYALANFFLLASTGFLVGPSKQIAQMFTADRAMSSGIYLGSLVLLFYVAWQWRSFFIVVPVLLVQFVSLAFYVMSYVPFGQGMLKRICSWTLGRQLSFLPS